MASELPREHSALGTVTDPTARTDPTTSTGGSPVTFVAGPYQGLILRSQLKELQGGKIGRKSGYRDRRALDPPPVLQLQLFQSRLGRDNEPMETEVDYLSFFSRGLVANIEVYLVPGTDTELRVKPTQDIGTTVDTHMDVDATLPPPVIARVGSYEITDEARRSDMLLGATFSQAVSVPYQTGFIFVIPFADISMKMEGVFLPRYRCFEVISTAIGNHDRPVLAECFGTPFRIYSTKSCPPMSPSTELTQWLSKAGVRVNARARRRRRGKPSSGSEGDADEEMDGEGEGAETNADADVERDM